jgi:hypothetical protein
MKKLFKISFLLAVLCFAVPVYADGDMPTGSRTCTQNCPGFYAGTTPDATDSDEKQPDEVQPKESTIEEIYSWIYQQISEMVD